MFMSSLCLLFFIFFFFFFNDTATTEIYTLSLHDALPISNGRGAAAPPAACSRIQQMPAAESGKLSVTDRKSTRLNSSHSQISYAVFCLKKKKKLNIDIHLIRALPHP